MTNVTILSSNSSLILDEEIDRLRILCSKISQMASRIQLPDFTNISSHPEYIKLFYNGLLSISENIEGASALLESMLSSEERNCINISIKKPRYHYSREELLKLRERVTPSSSIQIKNLLNEVAQRETDPSTELGKYSSRNIRTILV